MRGVARSLLLLVGSCAFGCTSGDPEPKSDAGEASDAFEMVLEDLDAALFSIWGTSEDDVWTVGADAGDGPMVLHYDGDVWQRHDTGASGDLWWTFGTEDSIWMSGAGGLVLRYDLESGDFEDLSVPGGETLFGIFPASDNDVWAVGGVLEDAIAVVYHYDGSDFRLVDDLPAEAMEAPFFKVWGRSSDDLWIVGFGDVALHKDGEEWNVVPVPTGRRLFTVHGNTARDADTLAVGGFSTGLIVEVNDEGALQDVSPDGVPQLNGVWVEPSGDVLAAGVFGSIWTREDGDWVDHIDDVPVTTLDYHAVFVDTDGGEWAVGGQIMSEPFRNGMLAHRGRAVGSEIEE